MGSMSSSPKPLDLLVTNLIQVTGLLIRRSRAEHPHELSIPQSQAMARLAEAGPMTTADLARAEAVKPQSMGATLAPLEQDGLVERQAHPTDGRQMLFSLTAKGLEFRTDNKDAKRNWLRGAVARLSPEEQRTLTEAVEIIRKVAE